MQQSPYHGRVARDHLDLVGTLRRRAKIFRGRGIVSRQVARAMVMLELGRFATAVPFNRGMLLELPSRGEIA